MDFLTKIIAAKRQRITDAKARVSLGDLRALARKVRADTKPNCFAKALRDDSKINIIAEFKRRSPSKGDINSGADAAATARVYESAGAAAVSVLTEEDFFDGSLADLQQIREAIALPLLRKDFIIDEYQIFESAAAGADALLLIVAALDDGMLSRLRSLTEDELGMDALVEVHTQIECDRAVKCGAKLIGVNNRNLHTFEVSTVTSEQIARAASRDLILVSESGLTPEAVPRLRGLGYKGFLVGEALMRAIDPAEELRAFLHGRTTASPQSVKVKICGITNAEDALSAIDAGADMLGFNFFRGSPRYVDSDTAREIIDTVRSQTDRGSVTMVGVFVNESLEEVLRIADDTGLDGIQLHGDETVEFCEQLKGTSRQRMFIRALSASTSLNFENLSHYPVDLFMIDTFDPKLRGGTGRTADWTIARKAAERLPGIILAGGLSPENVAEAIDAVHPIAVDACSSLETTPGKKNVARVREFVNAVRASKLQADPARTMTGEGN